MIRIKKQKKYTIPHFIGWNINFEVHDRRREYVATRLTAGTTEEDIL